MLAVQNFDYDDETDYWGEQPEIARSASPRGWSAWISG